jgi:type IX secretion system PorP/SprF family membrane protein
MRKLIIAIAIGVTGTSFAQQLPQYSQYLRNQFMVNPGAAGVYDFYDITVGGRYQWAGFDNAPMTAYVYGSTTLPFKKVRYNPSLRTSQGPVKNPEIKTGKLKHAVGAQMVADEYGAFRKLSFAGTYAIHLPLSTKVNMSFGTKLGVSNNSFLQDRATVLTEMPGYTGPAMTDQEYYDYIANQSATNFMDIGAGLYIYSNRMFFGFSADQLTGDMVSFGSGTANFDPNMHFMITGGYKMPLNDNLSLMPAVLAKIMAPAPVSIEGSLQLEYKEWLWFGLSYRHTDAVIAMLGANISEKFKFGYSFDYSLSRFNDYSAGGHEIMLGLMLGR